MTFLPNHIPSTTLRIGATLTAVRPGGSASQDTDLFNEMADVSLGRPSAGSPFLDAALCGYLLILREFMHHLTFGDVIVEAASDPAASHAR